MRRVLFTILLLGFALPALAQQAPPTFPTRDVSITYRMNAGQERMQDMTMAWLAAARTMRMDIPGLGWLVADHRTQTSFMVMEEMRMVMAVPMARAMAQGMGQAGPGPGARYRRTGSDTVAGTRCTLWSFEEGDSRGTACITEDGVMLRAQGGSGGQSGGMEAIRVTYATQDPARFQRPAGYQTMQMPQGMPGQPGAGRK